MPGCLLKNIPDEIYKRLLAEQAALKQQRKSGQYSIEMTVYCILRDYFKQKDKNENLNRPDHSQ